jgi:hypothetical protein
VILTGEPGMPALDPSYAWNSTGASGPAIASNTCASAIYIPSVYGRFANLILFTFILKFHWSAQ